MRTDIQALRGVAVLLVIFYHGGWSLFTRGYLGVDVFFVISGYLISRLIVKDVDAGSFSFRQFYARRARRLLPAAYCTLFLTSVAAAYLLPRLDFSDFVTQLVGAMTFTGNIVLWRQTGYFEGAAEAKPLLHVWSLSLEEQFYLALPLALYLTPRRYRRHMLFAGIAASTILCAGLVGSHPSATFFLLPTRAWELLMGAAVGVGVGGLPDWGRWRTPAAAASLSLIMLCSTLGFDPRHPRLDALLVCCATAFLIMLKATWLDGGWLPTLLARVGDMSYSLYLLHWPPLALARSVWLDGELPVSVVAVILVSSFVAAWLMYTYVEVPFRSGKALRPRFEVPVAALTTVLLIALPGAKALGGGHAGGRDWTEIRRTNFGFGSQCSFEGPFPGPSGCSDTGSPELLVWGDSFAMHLVEGLRRDSGFQGVVQATMSSCGPNIAAAPTRIVGASAGWDEVCLAFNRSVVSYLESSSSIRFVLLSSTFQHYMGDLRTPEGARVPKVVGPEDSFASTIRALRATGARVVVVAPPPRLGSNLGLCLERIDRGDPFISRRLRSDCSFERAAYIDYDRPVIDFLRRLETVADVAVIWPSDVLCKDRACVSSLNGVPIYRDDGHLSYSGSREVARGLGLGDRIRRLAK